MARRVLVYELNEVPWEIVDLYVAARPRSNVAAFLGECRQLTTVDEDPVELMPWRSWPTLHTSRFTDEHNAFDQGQDPATFRGTPLWDVAADAGRKVGVFGPLQSWPPRPFPAGGFFVPDSFARSPAAIPASLERFQAFNTAMTRENGFAAEDDLSAGTLAKVGVDIVRLGLTPWSAARLAEHVVRERLDRRYLSRRAAMQVLPCFDLFWRLHRRESPDLSIFFSNHVASMMHRFWGDWVPGYAATERYQPDPVYRGFILTAMDLFDHQLGRIRRWVSRTPGAVVVVASSMGQGPIPYQDMAETYVVDDAERLARALGLDAEPGLAMYPRITLMFGDDAAAAAAEAVVGSVQTDLGPLFRDLRVVGTTLSFEVGYVYDGADLPSEVRWERPAGQPARADIAEIGISCRRRPGGGNTAQHIPEGILLVGGEGVSTDARRDKVSILDVAPSLLDLLGVQPSDDMRGSASLFA